MDATDREFDHVEREGLDSEVGEYGQECSGEEIRSRSMLNGKRHHSRRRAKGGLKGILLRMAADLLLSYACVRNECQCQPSSSRVKHARLPVEDIKKVQFWR